MWNPFYGAPGLTAETADAGAREHNARPPLSEAWRYPTRDAAELDAEVRRIVGPEATFERTSSALRVAVARCEASEVTRWAAALAALDTRVYYTCVSANDDGSTRFEAFVWVDNPHGQAPRPTPLVVGRALRGSSEASLSATSCRCGAKHVAFVSRKAYPGQERDDIPVPCLACGRGTLVVLGVPDSGGFELHLLDRLPPARVSWLPRTSDWQPSQRDLPLPLRVLAAARMVVIGLGAFGLAALLVALLLGRRSQSGPRSRGWQPPVAPSPAAESGAVPRSPESPGARPATCTTAECVHGLVAALRNAATAASARETELKCDELDAAIDAGNCPRAVALVESLPAASSADTLRRISLDMARVHLSIVMNQYCPRSSTYRDGP